MAKDQSRTVTGTAVVAVYESMSVAVIVGGTTYDAVPYPAGHTFNLTTPKATEYFATGSYEPFRAFDPSESRVGGTGGTAWSSYVATGSVKVNVDLGTARSIQGLWIDNYPPESSCKATDDGSCGVRQLTVQGSNSAGDFDNVTWDACTPHLGGGTFTTAKDGDVDAEQPQYFTFTTRRPTGTSSSGRATTSAAAPTSACGTSSRSRSRPSLPGGCSAPASTTRSAGPPRTGARR